MSYVQCCMQGRRNKDTKDSSCTVFVRNSRNLRVQEKQRGSLRQEDFFANRLLCNVKFNQNIDCLVVT